MPIIEMTTNPFNQTCIALFGPEDWKPKAADLLNVNLRTVQYWAAGAKPVPPGIFIELVQHIGEAVSDMLARVNALQRASIAIGHHLSELCSNPSPE